MRCPRGFDHAAIVASPSEFAALRYVGVQPGSPAETIAGVTYEADPDVELRDCPCGSTLGREVAASMASRSSR